ncbi:MAG: 4Fe-4S dicluster domain-containing protein, partial [Ignavibacteriae bacterium]|nr:4Fe-4S dicluster domain-containing protein [Ignavibacteriota bacterium]
PDPASINAAAVCGIAANNASGMTSGVKNNCYNTVANMRIIFSDGQILDTSDSDAKIKFVEENRQLIVELLNIALGVNKNDTLKDRINKKYAIKNTTGYGVNSLIDFKDPIEIIKHIMIGSEGTLGFISEITLNTVTAYPNKATALIIFPNIKTACSVIPILNELPVDAAELMDRASLRSVENKIGMPDYLKTLSEDAAALLIETSAIAPNLLNSNINKILNSLEIIKTEIPIEFTNDKKEYLKLWNVRKGLFPSVSKSRKPGTTVIIEDLNFNTIDLANAVSDLRLLFAKHNYAETIIWGHALSGNIHFVFAQDFNNEDEVKRYKDFMKDVVELVIKKYDGSLKAEHGTGRNMAPFVKYEWGSEIYDIMCKLKNLFDPKGILNPGVLINSDDEVHLKNLKPTPIVDAIIDKCIDCGFCESVCPSKNLTLTPRQRITVWREISKLKISSESNEIVKSLEKAYKYYGEQTCATDGLCELSCPVDIDTGKLIKHIRNNEQTKTEKTIANWIANHFSIVTSSARIGLSFVGFISKIIGANFLESISSKLHYISKNKIPLWNKAIPLGAKFTAVNKIDKQLTKTVVYFPSCISRTFGKKTNSNYAEEQHSVMERLFKKAGYNVIYPENVNSLCCGMAFSSKGFFDEAKIKHDELYKNLLSASNNGQHKIIFDTSPCVKTIKDNLQKANDDKLQIYDSIEFIHDYLLNELNFTQKEEPITVHSTCSATKMDLQDKLISIAKKCSTKVFIPEDVNCCGFAGDRGFNFPELNKSALQNLDLFVEKHNCKSGYSTSKTCEIGLTNHSGINYESIAYLVDECSE